MKTTALGIYFGEISATHKGLCVINLIGIGFAAKIMKARAIGVAQCGVRQTIQTSGQLAGTHIYHLAQDGVTPLWVASYGEYMAMVCGNNNQGFIWITVVDCSLNRTGKLNGICQGVKSTVGMVTMINATGLYQQKVPPGVFIENIQGNSGHLGQ